MPDQPLPRFICPWCDKEIDNIEFRGFGPKGILTMVGCDKCLKPLGVFLVPDVEAPPKKSPIVT